MLIRLVANSVMELSEAQAHKDVPILESALILECGQASLSGHLGTCL